MTRPAVVLSPSQIAGAVRARESGSPLVLDDDYQVERREGGWVVVDRLGHTPVNIHECTWDATADPETPPLTFPTPEEATVGYLQSKMIGNDRSKRHGAAMKRLGRQE